MARSVLVTRPAAQAASFARRIEGLGDWVPLISPLLEIVPTGREVVLSGVDSVIFTSGNGVRHAPPGAGHPALCVGQHTTDLAAKAGWTATFAGADVAALIDGLTNQTDKRYLHVRGTHTTRDLADALGRHPVTVAQVAVYDQRAQTLSAKAITALTNGQIDLVTLFSPRTAAAFSEAAKDLDLPGPLSVLCLSPNVATALGDQSRLHARTVETPDENAMLRAIMAHT